jgi:hypothetical protein
MIYFVQGPEGGPIKIGTTTNLGSRLPNLEASSGQSLGVLGVMDGGRPEERELHRRFAHLLAAGREWFHPGDDLLAFIEAETRDWQGEVESPAAGVIHYYVGTPEMNEWLREAADFIGMPMAILLDVSLSQYARDVGYATPMPMRRNGRRLRAERDRLRRQWAERTGEPPKR